MRNPNWTIDELILALDLYFRVNPLVTSETNPEIVSTSDLLNRLPIHSDRHEVATFRNPNGVYMKLCNFLRLDPSYKGEGLRAGSRLDEHVWNEFAADRPKLHRVAEAIRQAANSQIEELQEWDDIADAEAAPEGRILTRIHRFRERKRTRVQEEKGRNESAWSACL